MRMKTSIVNTSTGLISESGARKLKVLFVGNPANHLPNTFQEIDFSNATVSEAHDRISKKQIAADVVVVDATLALSEIKALRKVTKEKDLPLIFYTPNFDQAIKEMALRLGADDYFSGSMRHTFTSRLKLIKQLRKFKIQWLKHEHKYNMKKDVPAAWQILLRRVSDIVASSRKFKIQWLKHEHKYNMKKDVPAAWQILLRRVSDIVASSAALILLSPLLLALAIAEEIESMEEHVFPNSKNKTLADQIFNWYQFIVLILFSPIFMIIKFPLKIMTRKERLYSAAKNQATRPDKVLIKKANAGLSKLISILKGDISLFGARPLHMRESRSMG